MHKIKGLYNKTEYSHFHSHSLCFTILGNTISFTLSIPPNLTLLLYLIVCMAKTGVVDSDPSSVLTKTTELKKELQRLVRAIVDDEECSSIETIDQAKETLWALKELKLKKRSVSFKIREALSCPQEFRCPLSKELMRDPVIVASGQTYDRPFIEKWLKAGNRTCPKTQQVLSHTNLTPNYLVQEWIAQWCKNRGIQLSDPVHYINEEGITESDRCYFISLLEKMSATLSDQKAAARELRLLTKRMPFIRALFSESEDAIPQLLSPLSGHNSLNGMDPDLQEDVITTLLNISIHDNNKKLVAETPVVIPLLMEALRSGTLQTRANAAATIFTLSALESNKALIGKSGALKPLIDLLEEGHPLAMKDVASAIFSLCVIHENKGRAVNNGAVSVILEKITKRKHVDELLAILAMLASHQRAVDEIGELGAVATLLSIIRESTCDRNKENCIAIIHTVCLNNRSKLREIKEEEKKYKTISELACNGTSRAKRKASGILERLQRAIHITHTA